MLEQLAAAPDHLESVVRDFAPTQLDWTPPDWAAAPAEQFSALATVCHLRDIERIGYHVRLERIVTERHPDLESVDGFALADQRNYRGESMDRALAEFRVARAESVERVRRWSTADFDRTATFAEYGKLTARGLLHLLSSHDLQHLSGLRWLLVRASALG
jgi:hypothetical protein